MQNNIFVKGNTFIRDKTASVKIPIFHALSSWGYNGDFFSENTPICLDFDVLCMVEGSVKGKISFYTPKIRESGVQNPYNSSVDPAGFT